MSEPGRQAVRAIVRGAAEKNALERERRAIPDPPIGGKRDGVAPGLWGGGLTGEPEAGAMPPDCPVQVLGINGDELYVIDAAGQLAVVGDGQFGQGKVERLFGDRIGYVHWAWPRFGKAKKGEPPRVDTFRTEKVRQSLWGEGMRRGLFDRLEAVRGRGLWLGPGGGLIAHCGDYLYVNGRMQFTGEIDGKLYPRMAPILHPWPEQVGEQPALELMEKFRTFSWSREKTDPLLMLGWIGCAMMSGALRVRPSVLIVGDKGWGKSTLQELVKIFFGPYLLQTNNTTPAGIYQKVKQDARPVAIDELEAGADNRRVLAITELAKQAYSGGLMLRGGSDHEGVEFEARSSFLLSMINPPPVPPAELSRMGVLSLVRPSKERTGPPPVIRDSDELGSKILKRLMDSWPQFDPLFTDYSQALKDGGHEQRGQDTYGTLLTLAHMMLGDHGMDELHYPLQGGFGHWSEALSTASLPEYEDAVENWYGCLGHLFTRNLDVYRGGSALSVGAVLENYERGDLDWKQINHRLGQVTLKLLDAREVKGATGHVLAVPNSSPNIAKIFEGSIWQAGPSGTGGWAPALRMAPEGVMVKGADNRITINRHGFRCTLIDLAALDRLAARVKPAVPGGF